MKTGERWNIWKWTQTLESQETRVSEDQFLGALLGTAIGEALGVPLRGLAADEIASRFGEVTGYVTAEPQFDESGLRLGQIADKSEIVLCIVESLTTNDGVFDFENINARMSFVARSASRETMSEATIAGIERAALQEGVVDADGSDPEELAVATRAVPFGLIHSLGDFDRAGLEREASLTTRLSHSGRAAALPTLAVGLHVVAAARRPDDLVGWLANERIEGSSPAVDLISRIGETVASSSSFEDGVFAIVREGGEADSTGAIAGAIAGARFGASGIPQSLIDDLDARIYLTLAAPWFYRTALRRQGTVIDLRSLSG
jgi:ADP-ribosyl-[dinitrogen reductase] hydrolase